MIPSYNEFLVGSSHLRNFWVFQTSGNDGKVWLNDHLNISADPYLLGNVFFFFFWIECNSPLQVAKSCTRTLGVYVVILSSEFTVNLHVASFPITDTCNSTESAGSYAASGRTTCVLGLLERSYFMFSSLVTTGSLCCHPVNGSMKYSQVWYILSLESKMMWSLCLLILLDCSTMPQTIVFLKISLMWLAPTSS